jgi:hypothetical protein
MLANLRIARDSYLNYILGQQKFLAPDYLQRESLSWYCQQHCLKVIS